MGGDWDRDPGNPGRRTNGRFFTFLVRGSQSKDGRKGKRVKAISDGKSKPLTAPTWRALAISIGIWKANPRAADYAKV